MRTFITSKILYDADIDETEFISSKNLQKVLESAIDSFEVNPGEQVYTRIDHCWSCYPSKEYLKAFEWAM